MRGLGILKSIETDEYTIVVPDGRRLPLLEAHLNQRAINTTPTYMGVPLQSYETFAPMPSSEYGYVKVQDGPNEVWYAVDWGRLGRRLDTHESPNLPVEQEPIIGSSGRY